jgi:hypothetical protein
MRRLPPDSIATACAPQPELPTPVCLFWPTSSRSPSNNWLADCHVVADTFAFIGAHRGRPALLALLADPQEALIISSDLEGGAQS